MDAGIYVGNDKVIHFTRVLGQKVRTGTVLDGLLLSSLPNQYQLCSTCSTCPRLAEGDGVVSSCLDCFLAGGVLYRFEYGVNPVLFLAKARGGTCTIAVSDPDDIVVNRAAYLLNIGVRSYNVLEFNCEDFAIYYKTSLVVIEQGAIGQSGQVTSIIGVPISAILATPLLHLTSNVYGIVATGIGICCQFRYATDIGMRKDVAKVAVEDLNKFLPRK